MLTEEKQKNQGMNPKIPHHYEVDTRRESSKGHRRGTVSEVSGNQDRVVLPLEAKGSKVINEEEVNNVSSAAEWSSKTRTEN